MDNLFLKKWNLQTLLQSNNLSTFTNNFSSNLTPLLTTLKESLEGLNPNNSQLQDSISKLVSKVENLIQEHIKIQNWFKTKWWYEINITYKCKMN